MLNLWATTYSYQAREYLTTLYKNPNSRVLPVGLLMHFKEKKSSYISNVAEKRFINRHAFEIVYTPKSTRSIIILNWFFHNHLLTKMHLSHASLQSLQSMHIIGFLYFLLWFQVQLLCQKNLAFVVSQSSRNWKVIKW